jgi:hypothetical protein
MPSDPKHLADSREGPKAAASPPLCGLSWGRKTARPPQGLPCGRGLFQLGGGHSWLVGAETALSEPFAKTQTADSASDRSDLNLSPQTAGSRQLPSPAPACRLQAASTANAKLRTAKHKTQNRPPVSVSVSRCRLFGFGPPALCQNRLQKIPLFCSAD